MFPVPLRWLTAAASVLAAVLGFAMLTGGLGLGVAQLTPSTSAPQPTTTAVLVLAGLGNVASSLWIWRARLSGVICSAVASLVPAVYLGAVLNDRGEPFWLHVVLLALLTVVGLRLADMRAET